MTRRSTTSPGRHHDYPDSGTIVRRPGARTAPGSGGRCTDGTRFHGRNPRRRRRRAYPHQDLIPEGASVFTGASETLRLSGIEEDINTSGRYQAIRPRGLAMDRTTQMDEIRRLLASPDVIVGSVAALTETGSLVIASASGSQLPGYAGGAARAIWIVGAQKVVPDLSTRCAALKTTAYRWKAPAPRRPTGSPAPSTAFSSSTHNPTPGAAPSCCSAKPSDSEPPGVARLRRNHSPLTRRA
jgi:hypothetical protein